MINFQIYKTHIKAIKPALIKPVKPAGLGFMIKPGFYANPDIKGSQVIILSLNILYVVMGKALSPMYLHKVDIA